MTDLTDFFLAITPDEWSDEDEAFQMSESFTLFLHDGISGPHVDHPTIQLLSRYGVTTEKMLVMFCQWTYSDMLSSFTDQELRDTPISELQRLHIYGDYLSSHNLVRSDGDINIDDFDPQTYSLHFRMRRRSASETFVQAFNRELDRRLGLQRLTAAQIEHARTTPPAFTHDHRTGTFVTPERVLTSPLPEVIHSSSQGGDTDYDVKHNKVRSAHVEQEVTTPKSRRTRTSQHHHKSIESFFTQLDYQDQADDDDGFLFMTPPTADQLHDHDDNVKDQFSMAHGDPVNDPAFVNRIQNPDVYGGNPLINKSP